MTIIDISRVVSTRSAVWPGDRLPRFSWTTQRGRGSPVNVGVAHLSLHTGTHVDAPLHYADHGASVDQLPLQPFFGPTYVVDVADAAVIRPQHLDGIDEELPARVLFKTSYSGVADEEWRSDFPTIDPETIRRLGQQDVVLIGTDAPSLDPVDSQDLPAHHVLHSMGMYNLEHLNLEGIAPGSYRLIALPLRLEGMDASPVRAVLIRDH